MNDQESKADKAPDVIKNEKPKSVDAAAVADAVRTATQEAKSLGAASVAAEAKLGETVLSRSVPDDAAGNEAMLKAQSAETVARTEVVVAEIAKVNESGAEGSPDKPEQKATDMLERSMEGREVKGVLAERAKMMAVKLDAYVEANIDKFVERAIAEAEKKAKKKNPEAVLDQKTLDRIGAQTRAKAERSRDFFVTVDEGKRKNTPLERMAQTYEYLDEGEPKDPAERAALDAAIDEHMEEIVGRSFDQQIDNPEQYVSHGFDHSLNVADYAKDIFTQNPEIVSKMVEEYGISEGEAKFMLEQVAQLHDCGYPHVGDRAKSVHGIAGGDLVSSPKMKGIFDRIITKSAAKKDELNQDLRDSILFHSADKIERTYGAKVKTTTGEFLTQGNDVVKVISAFYKEDSIPEGGRRSVTEVLVSDEKTKTEIEEALAAARLDTEYKEGSLPDEVKVTVINKEFKGRTADLIEDKDKLLGLEYSLRDATEAPLHSIIRLADNMDMRSNRFSEVQRQPAFRDVYVAMGDNGGQSDALKNIESLEGDEKKGTVNASAETVQATVREAIIRENNTISESDTAAVAALKTPKEAAVFWKARIVDSILNKPEHASMSANDREKIASLSQSANSESMRHFGGCEAIGGVKLKQMPDASGVERPTVIVTVDRAKFDALNATVVTESGKDENGQEWTTDVGVAEYQVWRAEAAYASLSVDKQPIRVRVFDKEGAEIIPTYRSDAVPSVSP